MGGMGTYGKNGGGYHSTSTAKGSIFAENSRVMRAGCEVLSIESL